MVGACAGTALWHIDNERRWFAWRSRGVSRSRKQGEAQSHRQVCANVRISIQFVVRSRRTDLFSCNDQILEGGQDVQFRLVSCDRSGPRYTRSLVESVHSWFVVDSVEMFDCVLFLIGCLSVCLLQSRVCRRGWPIFKFMSTDSKVRPALVWS